MVHMLNVLFLCTGNSARSIMAEALLNNVDAARFKAFSAGSFPKGKVHPLALDTLAESGLSADGYRSKSWDEFAEPGAPEMNVVITVCDQAAGEACPIWPGHPATAHWGIPDPAAAGGTVEDQRQAFRRAYRTLKDRIDALVTLPFESLDRGLLEKQLNMIGQKVSGSAD
jgi:arsenate reductase (thioredoxin)